MTANSKLIFFNATNKCMYTQMQRSGWKHKVRCTYRYTLRTYTCSPHTHTRGRGDLIKCRQRLCGLAYSEAGSQAATATVHLGQLDVASKPGRPQSNGFTGDIVVCVVSNQQCPLLGSAAAEAAERVTWQQPVQQRPACMLCDLPLMCMWWNRRPRGWK